MLSSAAAASTQPADKTGVLLLAHGGNPDWNDRVTAIAKAVSKTHPAEIAFGMATRANIQGGVDRLVAQGVTRIVAVPLFVSSHSSVVTSTEYLLGLRPEMPKDLLVFAKMSHGSGGAHADHAPGASGDGTRPVRSPVPITMTSALNHHPLVAAILADRARSISREAAKESVVIAAHGPVSDEDNARWLADMKQLAAGVDAATGFASIDYLTVRDDARKPIRDAATAQLRALVEKRLAEGRSVLIVPLLLSYGGIEQGLHERLQGLDYRMADRGLTPDDRIVQWVRESVASRH
jgi:sirohydrochlorin ferrochelatase